MHNIAHGSKIRNYREIEPESNALLLFANKHAPGISRNSEEFLVHFTQGIMALIPTL